MLADKLRSVSRRPIEYVGGYVLGILGTTSNVTVTFGGNLTGGLASSASAGDLVVVYFATGSTADRDLVVSGYTEVADIYSDDNIDTNLVVAYKFMPSTPETSFVLTGGTFSINDAGAVVVQVWRNVNTTTPLDVTATTAVSTANVPNPPAITPITTGAVVVSGGASGGTGNIDVFTSSNLNGFIQAAADDSNDVRLGVGYFFWLSGTFDPATFGGGSGGASFAAVTLALRPA